MAEPADLPVLDFSQYAFGDRDARLDFCKSLYQGLQRWGFVKLHSYGIDPDAIDRLFQMARRFFELPYDQKMLAPHPAEANPHRGYSFVGQEFTSALSRAREQESRESRRLFDIKETFDWGAPTDVKYPSVWPPDDILPGFRTCYEDHFAHAYTLHLSLLQALAEGAGVPSDSFSKLHSKNEGEARLAHYPAVEASSLGSQQGTSRICEHTDSGSITLLWQDSIGGLEIQDPTSGNFMPVQAPAPTMLVNLGDATERWSNGNLPAAYHRVAQPPHQDQGQMVPARFSIVYFGKPDRDVSLSPLKHFPAPLRSTQYTTITGDDLNQGTLMKTYDPEEAIDDRSRMYRDRVSVR